MPGSGETVAEGRLRDAGRPEPIDEARFQALRPAVEASWRQATRRQALQHRASRHRASRHRARRLALAALLVVAIGAGWWWRATAPEPAAAWRMAVDGASHDQPIAVGAVVATADERWAIRTADGHRLRLDRDTRVRVESVDRWRLEAGSLFVDAAPPRFVVATPVGTVEHLGTRYAVSWIDGVARAQVREGRVRWQGRQQAEAGRGEALLIDADGSIEAVPMATDDPSWAWVAAAAPPFEADGRSVAEILEHLAIENGWRLDADSAVAAEWSAVLFEGSIEGLDAPAAAGWIARAAGWSARLDDATVGGATLIVEASESDR